MPKKGYNADNIPNKMYDRQPDESNGAWRAFQAYLELGSIRTLKLTAEAMDMSVIYMKKLSTQHNWRERGEAYDYDIGKERMDSERKTIAQLADKWGQDKERKILEVRGTVLDVAALLVKRAQEMLSAPLYVAQVDRNGQPVIDPLTGGYRMIPNGWTMDTAGKLGKAGLEMAAWSLDLPMNISKQDVSMVADFVVDIGEPPPMIDVTPSLKEIEARFPDEEDFSK